MAQWKEALATKMTAEFYASTYMVEGESRLLKIILWPLHVCYAMCPVPCTLCVKELNTSVMNSMAFKYSVYFYSAFGAFGKGKNLLM